MAAPAINPFRTEAPAASFTAKTTIERADWDLTWNMPVETGGLLVGKKVDLDYELFLRDLEEDLEMRGAVNLYKVQKDEAAETAEIAAKLSGGKQRAKGQLDPDVRMTDDVQEDDGEEDVDFPEIKLDELLEEFDEMTLQDNGVHPHST